VHVGSTPANSSQKPTRPGAGPPAEPARQHTRITASRRLQIVSRGSATPRRQPTCRVGFGTWALAVQLRLKPLAGHKFIPRAKRRINGNPSYKGNKARRRSCRREAGSNSARPKLADSRGELRVTPEARLDYARGEVLQVGKRRAKARSGRSRSRETLRARGPRPRNPRVREP
jgi:hypothetical protein